MFSQYLRGFSSGSSASSYSPQNMRLWLIGNSDPKCVYVGVQIVVCLTTCASIPFFSNNKSNIAKYFVSSPVGLRCGLLSVFANFPSLFFDNDKQKWSLYTSPQFNSKKFQLEVTQFMFICVAGVEPS